VQNQLFLKKNPCLEEAKKVAKKAELLMRGGGGKEEVHTRRGQCPEFPRRRRERKRIWRSTLKRSIATALLKKNERRDMTVSERVE